MRRISIFLIVLTFAGCSKKDPAQTLEKSIDSWGATLQLVADARLTRKVGAGFGKKTAEAAIEELTKESAAPSLPKSLTRRAQTIIEAAGALHHAIESDDPAAIARARSALAAQQARSE